MNVNNAPEIHDSQKHKKLKFVVKLEEHYDIEEKVLGQGSFGKVLKGKSKTSGVDCAIKVVKKSLIKENPPLKKVVENELHILHIMPRHA